MVEVIFNGFILPDPCFQIEIDWFVKCKLNLEYAIIHLRHKINMI